MVLKIGSILEVATSKGFAYAQYTHHNTFYGALIRVMKGLYEEPQTDLAILAQETSLFSTFFLVKQAVRAKLVKDIGWYPIPDFAEKFPILKQGYRNPKTNKVSIWHFWDGGDKKWTKDELTQEEKNYSLERISNFEMLKYRMEIQWTPQQDFPEE